MVHSAIERIMEYTYSDEDAKEFYSLAMETVFGELIEENGFEKLRDLEDYFGSDKFWMIYPVALEFFFTNIYGQDEEEWNVIDSFLANPMNGLTKDENAYLKALRPSVMSLYEVTKVEPDKSLTVKDMIRGGSAIKVMEKSLTRYVSRWDCLGARILNMGDHLEFAGGCLSIEPYIAKEMASWLKEMRDAVVANIPIQNTNLSKDYISHYAEVMWASEIAIAWIDQFIESLCQQPPEFRNNENHSISPVTITFPVNKNHSEVSAFFDKHREFDESGQNEWVWLQMQKGSKHKKQSYTIRGQVTLHEDCLVLFTNSRERSVILEDIISKKLADILGKPHREYQNKPAGNVENLLAGFSTTENDNIENELTPEERQEILSKIKDDHYHEWLSMRIPALDGKTPRMAKRTKKGRNQLIALLKDLENNENHIAKAQGIKAYDMTWMWEELGLERSL